MNPLRKGERESIAGLGGGKKAKVPRNNKRPSQRTNQRRKGGETFCWKIRKGEIFCELLRRWLMETGKKIKNNRLLLNGRGGQKPPTLEFLDGENLKRKLPPKRKRTS